MTARSVRFSVQLTQITACDILSDKAETLSADSRLA